MCKTNQRCRCHLIKPALTNDRRDKLRATYFEPSSMDDDYLFLKDAYEVMDFDGKAERFESKLACLNSKYIVKNSSKEINVSERERNAFKAIYDQFLEGDCNKEQVLHALGKLVNTMEKLVQNNLALNESFLKHLNQYDEARANDIQVVQGSHKHKTCTLF